MNLKVHKSKEQIQIFETLQGEGVHSGVPSFFIRLQGCSVNCFFCDEKPTWKYSPELSQELNIKDIIERFKVMNSKLKRVVITGGEPTEQNLVPFIEALIQDGYAVAIETAATGKFLNPILELKDTLSNNQLWVTLSPKEIYSQNGEVSNTKMWSSADEIKFVFASNKAKDFLLEKITPNLHEVGSQIPVFLVPDWHQRDQYQKEILNILKEYPQSYKLGIQAHKFWGLL